MSLSFSFKDRQTALNKMKTEIFDLVIIGGGITGAGVARDAASRGLTVALIEAHDFAFGTSSRSSKLIHGGIRYLENLEFHLVFEALRERQKLFEMAPHLVHPLRFLLPVYKTGRVPAWKMGLGMWLYDALSLFEAPETNQYLSVKEIAHEYPALSRQGLSGAFAYYDAYMDDDRLVIETLRSAKAHGAECANYVKASGAIIQNGRVEAVECRDQESGETFILRARHIVSSVGPWTDRLGADLFKDWKKMLRPSKGVHLTFLKERFPLQDAVVMGAESRIVFAIPRHEMVIVGTTDTDFSDDPEKVRAEKEDVSYILSVIDKYFPGYGIEAKDIVACYAGVRPLIDDGAQSESKTSREHLIWTDPHGVVFVAGGKYTTYRNMAEQVVETVIKSMSESERSRLEAPKTQEPLNPVVTEILLERACREQVKWARDYQVPERLTRTLAERHGLEALDILKQASDSIPFAQGTETWIWCAEAIHAVKHTLCLHLTDFFFRRTPLVLSRRDHGQPFIEAVAQTIAFELGWSEQQKIEEINALQNRLSWELSEATSS